MRQQIDIAEVEAATKIRAKYLRALENEEFELLPGPHLRQDFLRTYAEYLGLDPHLLVEEYRSDYEGLPEEEPAPALGRALRRAADASPSATSGARSGPAGSSGG